MKLNLLIIFLIPFTVFSQETYNVGKETRVTLTGSSSLGNWECVAGDVNGIGIFVFEDEGFKNLDSLLLTFSVSSILSGDSKIDSLTKIALKYIDFPHIQFEMTSFNLGYGGQAAARGKLIIGGVKNDITLFSNMSLYDNSISFSGNYTLDMAYYDIKFPINMEPRAKVDNSVNINFDLVFER